MVLYRLLKLIAFYLVFYQPTVVVDCILDRLSSLVGVSCNLANCISPMPKINRVAIRTGKL